MTSTSQAFGLEIYIWCLPSRRRAILARNILACLDETQELMLLAYNICCSLSGDWTLLHHTATLIHGLKALPPTHLERPIYRRQCCLSFIYVRPRDWHKSFCQRAETQAVLLPRYISTASNFLASQRTDFCNFMCWLVCPNLSSLQGDEEEEEARRRENRTRVVSPEWILDPTQQFLAVSA